MKRAFVLTTLLAVAGAALAQTHVLAEAQLPYGATKMIVRDYLSPATVSYIATASQNFFAYADAGNLMRCMPLDSRYDVRDMKVSGGNVYFCGQDTYLGRAFLGWFNVTDVLGGIDGYHIFNNFVTDTSSLSVIAISFEQLEINKGYDVQIALVGSATGAPACIVEVKLRAISGPNQYTIGYPRRPNSVETMTNIVQNRNYFITGGTLFNDFEAVSMRFFDKSHMFSAGPQNRIYRYTSGHNPMVCYPRAKFAMSAIGDDTVATASYWSYSEGMSPTSYNNGYDGILINAYVISSTLAGVPSLNTAFSAKCSYFQPISESIIERMIYSKYDNHLYLLGRHGTPIGLQSMISRIPIPPSATINNTYLPGYDFKDIDNFYSSYKYVCTGIRYGEPENMAYYSKPAGPTYQCAQKYLAPTTNENFSCKVEEDPLGKESLPFDFLITEPIETFIIPIEIFCQH